MKKTIGLGIIGLQAGEALIAVNDDRTTRLRVAALCSSTPGLAAQIAERYDILHYTADHVDMLPMPAIDAAAIFSPARDHYDHILAALVSNRHVLCTQPIANTLKGALDLAEEADKRGRKALFWHADRWTQEIEAIQVLVSGGDLGELRVLDAVVALPTPAKPTSSRKRAIAPLDLIYDGLSRAIDTLQWLGGDIIEVTGTAPGDRAAAVNVTLRFGNGALGRALVVSGSPAASLALSVYGSKGRIVNDSIVLDSIHGRPAMTFHSTPRTGGAAEPLLRCARHFEECLVKDCRPVVDHWDAVRTVAVCEAVKQSLAIGKMVCVPPAGREHEFVSALENPVQE